MVFRKTSLSLNATFVLCWQTLPGQAVVDPCGQTMKSFVPPPQRYGSLLAKGYGGVHCPTGEQVPACTHTELSEECGGQLGLEFAVTLGGTGQGPPMVDGTRTQRLVVGPRGGEGLLGDDI